MDRRILVVVGFVFAAMVGAGACGTNGQCEYGGSPGGSGTFVGRLTSVRGDRATFTVESFAANPAAATLASPPRAGESVDVRYDSDEIAFLRSGRRYSVVVFDTGNGLDSGVHEAGNCSFGTMYANGSAIDTSLWSRTIVRRAMLGFVMLLVATLVLLGWITRRSHRARVASSRTEAVKE